MSGEADRPRHAKGKGEWGRNPGRSASRDAAVGEQASPEVVPQGRRPPGKKDRDLCKAAHWKGPHVPAVALDKYAGAYGVTCEWSVPWLPREDDEPRWQCRHHEECKNCGRVLRVSVEAGECPGFREPAAEERAVIAAALARIRERLAERAARKPLVTGPQGYRRRRED